MTGCARRTTTPATGSRGSRCARPASTRCVSQAGANYFFLETPADGNSARLVGKPLKGGESRVLFDPATVSSPQRRASVDFMSPAPDGRHVAFVVFPDGSEDWALRTVDCASGRLLPDSLDRVATPAPSWDAQGRGFYYTRLQKLADGAPATDKYDKQRVYCHALGTDAKKGPGGVRLRRARRYHTGCGVLVSPGRGQRRRPLADRLGAARHRQ